MLQTVGIGHKSYLLHDADLLTTLSGREDMSPHLVKEYNSRIQFHGCPQPEQKPHDCKLAKAETTGFCDFHVYCTNRMLRAHSVPL